MQRWLTSPKTFVLTPLLLALVFIVACGGTSATSAPDAGAGAAVAGPTKTRVIVAVATAAAPVATLMPGETRQPTPTAQPVATAPVPGIGQKARRGGWVSMQAFESPGSDTYYGGNNADNTMTHIGAIFNQLIEYDPDTREGLDLRGGVAESWESSDDGLTYTFKIRKNMKFHDGTTLEMKDILHTFVTAFTPDEIEFEDVRDEIQGRTLGNAQTVQIYMKDWEAVDENTLAIHLNFPSSAFLVSLGMHRFPILSKDAIAEHGTFRVPNEGTLMGTGPYKFVSYDKDIVTELERNPDYHIEGRPYLDGVKFFPIYDIGTIIAAFKTEQVLMSGDYVTNLTVPDVVKLEEEMGGDLRVIYSAAPPYSIGVMMNANMKPFDDPRVRKAMNLIVHRQPAIDTLTAGKAGLGTPFPCGFAWGFSCEEALQMPGMRQLDGEKHPDDIAEAQQLMIDAGAPPGTKLEFTCRLVIEYCDIMLIVQSQLQKWLGWEITTRSLESTAGYDVYRAGQYQFAVQAIGFSYPDPDATAASYKKDSTSHTQRTFFYNEAAEPYWDIINLETDFAKRREAVLAVNQILLEDNSWAMVYHPTVAWPVNLKIQNFIDPVARAAYIQWDQIWCETC